MTDTAEIENKIQQFKNFREATQTKLKKYLASSLHGHFETLRRINTNLCDEVRNALTEFCDGGKAIRATLVELGYVIAGGNEGDNKLLPIQVSVELTHAALLIHDDIVDHSDMRRNKATLHRHFAKGHGDRNLRGRPDEYGNSVAMLVGDMALCLAHYYALASHFEQKEKVAALSSFIDNLVTTGLGQIMDIQLAARSEFVSADDILGMTDYKTAFYTVVAPMQLGALLAGGDELLKTMIGGFGSPLGVAYQLQDDILGLYGDPKDIGKSNLSDLLEGKQTLLMKYGHDLAGGDDRKFLNACMHNKELTDDDLARMREILKSCGAKAGVEKKAQERQQSAIDSIPSVTMVPRYQSALEGLCHYILRRDR